MNNVETDPLLRSANLLGRVLLLILVVLLVAVAGFIVVLIVEPQKTGQFLAAGVGYGDVSLRAWQSYALTAILLVQIGIWVTIIQYGRNVFSALKAVDIQAAGAAANRAARFLWLMLIWGILAHMFGTVIATWHFPAGQRALGINLGPAQISTAFAALLATFMSHAFALGASLWQDHQEVI